MAELKYNKEGRLLFTKQMKNDYTILLPMMAPIHFNIIRNVFTHYGYNTVLLDTNSPQIAQTGLKYVNNDTCYPAILVIGQLINALESGKYDLNKTALMITQTGGGCRASNYIHLLRKALKKAGLEKIPVISLNLSGLEKNSGFKLTLPMLRKMVAACVYGDLMMLLKNQVEPYEIIQGQTNNKVSKWTEEISALLKDGKGCSVKQIKENLDKIVKDFESISVRKVQKIKVGIVGEIYVKYAKLGNNNLESFLLSQDCEISVPGILGFVLFKVDNRLEDIKLYGGNSIKYSIINKLMNYILKMESLLINAVRASSKFRAPENYNTLKSLVKDVIGYGNKMGEGWLLTAEMLELAKTGYENIVCTQPFGCLPNHICGKGMIRKIVSMEKNANIVAIDYDAGATNVNQENRIKLMLSIAREKLDNKPKASVSVS